MVNPDIGLNIINLKIFFLAKSGAGIDIMVSHTRQKNLHVETHLALIFGGAMTDKPQTVEEYIGSKSADAQNRLEELRSYLRIAAPAATEELRWGKPAFVDNGIIWVYAAAKKHISLHPTPSVIDYFREEIKSFTLSQNTIQFPLENPIPKETVMKLATRRVYEKDEKGIGWK